MMGTFNRPSLSCHTRTRRGRRNRRRVRRRNIETLRKCVGEEII
jgi:hypothetical protein